MSVFRFLSITNIFKYYEQNRSKYERPRYDELYRVRRDAIRHEARTLDIDIRI